MTQWLIKNLSKLTGVTVQTLHHYDRIDLLKPSQRLANGYRVYSERDLLKLQQIIACKFFGFELSQIKHLLTDTTGAIEQFSAQAQFLEQKATHLLDASKALKGIISEVKNDKSIPWETIIKLIEVYRMTQQLEHSWVKDIFSPDELKQYAAFETEMITHSTPGQKIAFEKAWAELVEEVKHHLDEDPKSATGIRLGEKFMLWVNSVYGKKYAHLRTRKFEKGFGEGKGLEETGLTPEIVLWVDQAMDAYWRKRIYACLAQVGHKPSAEILDLWDELLDDMYGDDKVRKLEIVDTILKDDTISPEAKTWVVNLPKHQF